MNLCKLMETKTNKILLILTLFLLTISTINAQNYSKPRPLLPKDTLLLYSAKDTLWIMNNKHFKQTIIAKKQIELCRQQVDAQKNMIDTLQELNAQRQDLIDTLTNDRDFYIKNWHKAEEDLKLMGELNTKQSQYTKIAIIVGSATTVTAFIVGFILGLK